MVISYAFCRKPARRFTRQGGLIRIPQSRNPKNAPLSVPRRGWQMPSRPWACLSRNNSVGKNARPHSGPTAVELNSGYDACVLAPAGRNVYSHGITKPEAPAERHRNEYVAPRGFSSFGVGGYNHVAFKKVLVLCFDVQRSKTNSTYPFFRCMRGKFLPWKARRRLVSAPVNSQAWYLRKV